ncbi:MAG TPA: LptF/LptG family permease [Vicinamibacterales bacterium]|nr:LptF/LptG family permease [Vicinamibacterales bacterium]
MRTLDRYIIREILPPFILSLLIFTFILEIPPVMRSLEQLVAKGVSWGVAGRILLTLVPQGLGLTIPMATLTGILIGFGRLSSDRESVALLACGVSPYRLLRPVLAFALVMAGATMYVMLQAIPDANQSFREITFELVSKKVKSDIRPRVFFDEFPGFVLYARDDAPQGGWRDVMVADTRKPGSSDVFFAGHGDLSIDRPNQRVDLILSEGRRYSTGQPGQSEVYSFPKNPGVILSLDPKTVFNRQELPRTITEKTIADLRADASAKLQAQPVPLSPHPEFMYIQQKFSIPAACLVFAVIGLALGLTSARDTKMAGFVVGLVVVFAYYAMLELAAAQTRGHYRAIEEAQMLGTASWVNAHLARWWPNIIMGTFGIAALVWRAQFAHRGLPMSLPVRVPRLPTGWSRDTRSTVPVGSAAPAGARRPRQVFMVVRFPRMRLPGPGVLDRYISRLYARIVGLSFLSLLGLFYIAAFLDRSEKIFKGQATTGQVFQFLAYSTPQFVYFIIPIAALLSVLVTFGMLSRTSELTVMKACGVSLYRTALPLVCLSLLGSAALYSLEQGVLAESNRKAEALDDAIRGRGVRTINPLNRQWIVARDGSIYHYGLYDPQQRMLTSLSVYTPDKEAWKLHSQTFAASAEYRGEWTGVNGWTRDYSRTPPSFAAFPRRPLALEEPEYFGSEQPIAQLMTVSELRTHIADLRASGFNWLPLAVELQRKIAFPFVTLVMTLLAVPFGVSTGRRGTLYGIGIGIVIALAYWIVSSVFIAIGSAGLLPPFLAAWSPNIIVAGTAAFLFLNTRT